MDRNTVVGFVLLGVLLFIYLYTSTKNSHELEAQRKRQADSIAFVTKVRENAAREAAAKKDSALKTGGTADTLKGFAKAQNGNEQLVTLENELLKVVFSNKGGQPVDVELKKFKSYDSTPVRLVGPDCRISYPINTGTGAADIADLYFDAGPVVRNPDGSQTVRFTLPTPEGESIEHEFTLPAGDYSLNWNVRIGNPERLFSQNNFNLDWRVLTQRVQKNVNDERRLTSLG
ncbi:MAG TPA: YidC/Oxa1 family insertase periplasmic-domain containing protein, partial [Puia sp.]|nr:YidC/Oxa1 family insertase periplasmic-domain containing protein [Puia sp.]